jgi:hypothetical protein
MSKSFFFSIAFGLALFAKTDAYAQNIRCESLGYQPAACYHGSPGAEIQLAQQLSTGRGQCIYGQSWSYDQNNIYVNNGCRADFRVINRYVSVTCQSQNYQPASCYAGGPISSVRLVQQLSNGRGQCNQGQSWNYDRNYIYVNNGCRAVFEVRLGY